MRSHFEGNNPVQARLVIMNEVTVLYKLTDTLQAGTRPHDLVHRILFDYFDPMNTASNTTDLNTSN